MSHGAKEPVLLNAVQEMLDIMKAIYDMMGKCTYPVLKEETPRQHVEVFFQAGAPKLSSTSEEASEQPRHVFCALSPTEDGQEQRRRGDHRRVHRLLPKRETTAQTHRRRLGLASRSSLCSTG